MRGTDGALSPQEEASPELMRLDCCGMRCPQPVLRLAVEAAGAPAGMIVEIVGDCPTFEKDVRVFCERRKKTLLAIRIDGTKTFIRIRN